MTSVAESSPSPPVAGSCLCGAVRFEIELPTRFCVHCHCTICRRNHGAAFVTWLGVPKAQFRLLGGKDPLTRFASSEQGVREFCSRCGSSLFCELAADPDTIDITLASLAGPVDRGPELHVFFESHVEWVGITDSLPKLTSS